MRKFLLLLLCVVLAVGLMGCSQGGDINVAMETEEESAATSPEESITFLGDELNRENFTQALLDFNYDECLSILDDYIDSADGNDEEEKQAVALLNSAKKALEELDIAEDSFNGYVWLEAPFMYGIDQFSPRYGESYGIAARCYVSSTDWIFVNQIQIKVGDDEFLSYTFSLDEVTRDVVTGNGVRCMEIATIVFSDDGTGHLPEVEKILNSDNPIIRFTGDFSIDYEINDAELTTLNNLYEIYKVHYQLKKYLGI